MDLREKIIINMNKYYNGEKNIKTIANVRFTFTKEELCMINSTLGKTIVERAYNYVYKINNYPLCKICQGLNKRFKSFIEGYRSTCSGKCYNIEKYGVDNPAKNHNVIAKTKNTCIEKYGGPAPICSNVIKAKIKHTMQKEYGVSHYSKSEEYLTKVKKTNIERYGKEHYMQTKEAQILREEKCLEKHGVTHHMKLQEVCNKVMLNRDHDAISKKISVTRRNNFFIKLQEYYKKDFEFLFNIDDYHGVRIHGIETKYTRYEFKCKKCDTIFKAPIINLHYGIECTKCGRCGSKPQRKVLEFIESIYSGIITTNDRTQLVGNLEIDIFIPKLKIGIEFNGLYWHSELTSTPRAYHLNKTKQAEDHNINLIHIFEDEWKFKPEIVKSRLSYMLSSVKYKLYARNCTIKEIETKIKNKFLNKYHLQGEDKASKKLGLFYKERLVAVMTFCKSRFNKNYQWELSRYVTIAKFRVIGGAGKLLKHFERNNNPQSLITYADRRWSQGKLYNSLGFDHIHDSQPNYFYIINGYRESRHKFQKHKLHNILESFDSKLSEVKNMENNGYSRIWDCGNMVFVKNY